MSHLLLLSPAANRVYAGAAASLTAAELEICTGLTPSSTTVAGVDYLAIDAEELSSEALTAIARSSAPLALFACVGDLLQPVRLPAVDLLDDDFVTIPKYSGKTNEQFTRLLLNVTRAAATTKPLTVLDPLCGRGTTLSVAWTLGLNAAGVEADAKAFEAMAAFWKTWLRRKRLKHTADTTPVRREGKSIGRRFDATVQIGPLVGHSGGGLAPPHGHTSPRELTATVFTGDTRDSAKLFGKKKFELIVADAPYGVVHGSRTDVKGTVGKRDRSPAGLLGEAIGVWAGQLAPGGALGLSWNTLGLSRETLGTMASEAGLLVLDEGPWRRFAHRVDSSIHRDILVAQRPA